MKIDIYGRDNCPYCDKAKVACEENSIQYSYFNVGEDEKLKDEMAQRIGYLPPTVPQIFVDGVFLIGGYTGLQEFIDLRNMDDLEI